MSVINKMLRDLDQRQGAHSVNTEEAPKAAQRGTRSVPMQGNTPASSGRMRRGGWIVAAVLAASVGVGAAVWWYSTQLTADTSTAPMVQLATVAAPAPIVAVSEPVTVAPALPAESAPVAMASAPLLEASTPTVVPVERAERVAAPPPVPKPASVPATPVVAPPAFTSNPTVSLRMEPMLSARKALDAVLSRGAAPSAKAPTSPAAESTPPAQRQQQASTDALAQAQSLWNSGDQAAALDLMQRSVDAAERSVKAGTSTVGNPVLLSLVRESVRMQMTQSRFTAVWEQLTHLEPVLGSAPDLWALRANTAQRLGHHQDSVNAYRIALQSNPLEQRWLLGSAVSLAALGQTSQAADMAERARSVGEISREVQAYLRQLGVPLKDK